MVPLLRSSQSRKLCALVVMAQEETKFVSQSSSGWRSPDWSGFGTSTYGIVSDPAVGTKICFWMLHAWIYSRLA